MDQLDHQYIAALVKRAQQNDSNAFAELYTLTYQKQYAFARHYLKDEQLAQDAVQETYILALKNLAKLKDPIVFVAWLNQIAFRTCFDLAEKNKRNPSDGWNELIEVTVSSPVHGPEEQAVQKDEYRRLRQALRQLPAIERQVVVMRYYNSMKIADIVQATSLSRSTVKRYLASGEVKLHQILENKG